MIINPPALTIVSRHACSSCGASLPTPGRWAWVLGNGKRGELCLDCAALSPDERQQRTPATAVPEKWTAETYQDYLKSAHWRMFKSQYALREVKKCRVCGVYPPVQIDLHHNCYDHLGDERDHEVLWLCHDHHSLFHGKPVTRGELPY